MKNFSLPARLLLPVTLLLILALPGSAAPQDRRSQVAHASEPSTDGNAAQVEKFAKLVVGAWKVKVTREPNAERPKRLNDVGTSRIQYGPGRLSLMEDYRTEGDSGSRQALGLFWWDAKAHGFHEMFCDNRDPEGCSLYDGLGAWEGADLVFQFVFHDGEKQVHVREVLTFTSADSFTARFYDVEKGGTLGLRGTVEHTRSDLQ